MILEPVVLVDEAEGGGTQWTQRQSELYIKILSPTEKLSHIKIILEPENDLDGYSDMLYI